MIEVITMPPSPHEYNELRSVAGWPTYDVHCTNIGLKNSLFTVSVRDDGAIIAFGRVVGDGAITFYIQDIIVIPDRRGEGHARTVMEYLMQHLRSVAAPCSVVGLMSANGVEGFYEKFGFISRPFGEHMGAGMVMLNMNLPA